MKSITKNVILFYDRKIQYGTTWNEFINNQYNNEAVKHGTYYKFKIYGNDVSCESLNESATYQVLDNEIGFTKPTDLITPQEYATGIPIV